MKKRIIAVVAALAMIIASKYVKGESYESNMEQYRAGVGECEGSIGRGGGTEGRHNEDVVRDGGDVNAHSNGDHEYRVTSEEDKFTGRIKPVEVKYDRITDTKSEYSEDAGGYAEDEEVCGLTEPEDGIFDAGSEEDTGADQEDEGAEYLGCYAVTAYCGGACCCGEWAGCGTSSGTWPEEGRTVACNSLPAGTRILIDGLEYIVEDTGYTEYGDEWIDIYFESHEEALAWGVQWKDIYLVR